jgi:hypothetical protein
MATDTTDTAWAVTWIAATGGRLNGPPVLAYGKDASGYLVAVRTADGTFPVANLAAVLAHAAESCHLCSGPADGLCVGCGRPVCDDDARMSDYDRLCRSCDDGA